jgi:hypothetical protein
MHLSNMYPPGRVLWALRDSDLHPSHRKQTTATAGSETKDKLRLFEVLDVEKVFSQIVFARDMLRSVYLSTVLCAHADDMQCSYASSIRPSAA